MRHTAMKVLVGYDYVWRTMGCPIVLCVLQSWLYVSWCGPTLFLIQPLEIVFGYHNPGQFCPSFEYVFLFSNLYITLYIAVLSTALAFLNWQASKALLIARAISSHNFWTTLNDYMRPPPPLKVAEMSSAIDQVYNRKGRALAIFREISRTACRVDQRCPVPIPSSCKRGDLLQEARSA